MQALEDRMMKNQESGSEGSMKKDSGHKDSLTGKEKQLRSEVSGKGQNTQIEGEEISLYILKCMILGYVDCRRYRTGHK